VADLLHGLGEGQQRLTFERYYWDGDLAGANGMPFPNNHCRQRKTTWIYVTWNAATLMLTVMNAYRKYTPQPCWRGRGQELRDVEGSTIFLVLAEDSGVPRGDGIVLFMPVSALPAVGEAENRMLAQLQHRRGAASSLTSSFVLPAIIFWNPMPTPSITASSTAQPIAPFRICLGPPRTASAPPVKKPAMMLFHGSSFFRIPLTAQSNVLKRPPHTPKLPPRTGARILIAVMAPTRLSPYGLFLNPLMPCQIVPPMACETLLALRRGRGVTGKQGGNIPPWRRRRQNH
jgi:hypothetical protein